MTVQIPQIHSLESGLLQDSSAQNASLTPFQKYLEEEQKRLAFMLSPFAQFNFGSWFAYPSLNFETEGSGGHAEIFSDMDPAPAENRDTTTQNYHANNQQQSPAPEQTLPQTSLSNPAQTMLQDLLARTGWLAPNLEASPLFYRAQLEGKLLSKLDLQFLVDEILSQVKVVKEKGKVELTLGLRPENLGDILLTLTSRSGMISVQIQAPEETRKLIEAELRELELALKKAKVQLEGIKVLATKEVEQHA